MLQLHHTQRHLAHLHVEHAHHARAVVVDDPSAGGADARKLVWSIGLVVVAFFSLQPTNHWPAGEMRVLAAVLRG
jgi:hypothetical protein